MTQQFDTIARFIEAPQIPQSVRDRAALLLVDTLGVAAGAIDLKPSIIARNFAVDFHAARKPTDQARLLFDGRAASIPGAAFAAATQIDNLDGHDGYNPTKGHIGCAVVPTLIAFAEHHPKLTSHGALDILAMSYEVGARAAISLHATVADYHTSGAWNGIASAAIGCRLTGANRAQLRQALGIAEYHGPRSQMMREIANPTMLHDGSGMGALTGSMAALLALRGFEGAPAITLEAPEVASYWSDLGSHWTTQLNYIKPYPACRWAHAPLDGMSALLQKYAFNARDIATVEVRTFAESAALFSGMPTTTGQAQYSLGFALCAMALYGSVGPKHISGAGLSDPSISKLLPCIKVSEDPKHSARFPARRCADITVTLKDGRQLHSGDVEARGGPEAPLDESEVHEKLMLFSGPTIGEHRADALWQMRHQMLEPGHLFKDLIRLVTAAP